MIYSYKIIFNKALKTIFSVLIFMLLYPCYSQKIISLKAEKLKLTAAFNIKNVIDARKNKDNIGQIFISQTEKESIVLKGGTVLAIKKMFAESLPQNDAQILILYKVLDLEIKEYRLPNGNVSGQMSLKVSFDRIGKNDTTLLTETTTSTSYLRSDTKMEANKYESILSPLFVKSLTFFDKWLELNAGKAEALVRGVKIIFLPENDKNDNDTIYHHSRKVTWDDFRGKPTNTRYGAAIFANFAYNASFRVNEGYIVATIWAKTYMVRGMSWVTPAAYGDYALAHEQLHFDIAKLVTERFKKKIASMKADLVIDLNSMIQYEYLESYREMNHLQKQYDNETQHSIDRQKQAQWQEKVSRWLEEK